MILAGGTGSRLWPITQGASKQLMPVYDKPMIYYPLTTLISAGITEIAIVATAVSRPSFESLLGDGKRLGLSISYLTQDEPKGLAHGLIVAEKFLRGDSVCLVLGDNLFNGFGISPISPDRLDFKGAEIFGYEVSNPSDYGVLRLDAAGSPVEIVEKPTVPVGKLAIPGIYFLDGTACRRSAKLQPSMRGELEIADLLQSYLNEGALRVNYPPRGSVWLDTGTFEALAEATEYVRVVQKREGRKLGCPEEESWRMNLITSDELAKLAEPLAKSGYGVYLTKLLDESK